MSVVVSDWEVDLDRLGEIALSESESYRSADPFPHIVIDDFVDPTLLEKVLEEVSRADQADWVSMGGSHQKKFSCGQTHQMGPATRRLINFMNGQEIIGFLEQLTGIKGLVADWQLAGGGIHALRTGGFLNVHADFNVQQYLRLDRRINLLIYLNKDWKEEYGGGLELWDKGMTRRAQNILPLFNRCVIFNTTDQSFHGNPQPVAAPGGRSRFSLAFYYYSNGRPAEETADPHMTIFRKPKAEETFGDRVKSTAKKFVPPIMVDALSALRKD